MNIRKSLIDAVLMWFRADTEEEYLEIITKSVKVPKVEWDINEDVTLEEHKDLSINLN